MISNLALELNFKIFFLIFSRILGVFLISPVLGKGIIAFRYRISISFVVTVALFPILSQEISWAMLNKNIFYPFLLVNQLITGFAIGFFILITMSAFQLLGQLISLHIGFTIGQIFDPMIGDNSYILSQFFYVLGIFIFLYLNGHIIMVEALYDSFFKVDLLNFANEAKNFSDQFIYVFKTIFQTGVKLSIPILGPIFLIYVAMGILGKFAPQINIFMIGFPIYIISGLLLLVFYIPFLVDSSRLFLQIFLKNLFEFIKEVSQK